MIYVILQNNIIENILLSDDLPVLDGKKVLLLNEENMAEISLAENYRTFFSKDEVIQKTNSEVQIDKQNIGKSIVLEITTIIGIKNTQAMDAGISVDLGTQLNDFINIKFLLEAGALGTAKLLMQQLLQNKPQYAEILNYGISEIDKLKL